MNKCGLFLICLLSANMTLSPSKVEFGAGYGPCTVKTQTDISTNIMLGIVTILITSKIGYDLSWHATYAIKTHTWYELLKNTIEKNKITSIRHKKLQTLFSPVDYDEMLQIHTWINKSYNSWLTPWNWTESQKTSLQNLKIIEILTLYADLLAHNNQITGANIIKHFRRVYGAISIYPLCFGYDLIKTHLTLISTLKNHCFSALLENIVDDLHNFQVLLRQEQDYQVDCQAKQTNDLQKEMITAVHCNGMFR